jgi:non-ribosomal peptide synthetase component F/predicted amino acid dehydrogenase
VPKGVPITHGSFGTYLQWVTELYPIGESDRSVDTSAVFFDYSALQIVHPLVAGATICMVPEALMRDPDGLIDYVERERITVWRGVPSVWERILTAIERRMAKGEPAPPLAHLRLFEFCGEAMYAGTVRRWMDIYGDRQSIVNLYGPAEATITVTYYEVREYPPADVTRIPIGRPFGTVTVAVLDEGRRAVRPGEIGELYIGGPTLSPGYLNDPELTARFFVDVDGQRMYRTRDLVIQREDGVLEFVGRSDDQVKIGGIRIELGDVEAALSGFPGVARAAVVKTGDVPGTEQLVAYLSVDGSPPAAGALRGWIGERIPAYMVPRRFVVLDHFPTTPTGKVNRRELRERPFDPATFLVDTPATAVETPTEQILAEIWKDVLGLPEVGRDDDFFALGGDSIRMLDVLVRLEGRVPFVPRAVTFYRNPTLSDFAAAIDAGPTATETVVVPPAIAPSDRYALTPTQAGFLLTEALHPGVAQNWCALLILEGPLDVEAFRRAADALVVRHPMLRTIFPIDVRPPQQVELPNARPLDLPFEDLSGLVDEVAQRDALDARLQTERETAFAVDRWPLFRMRLLRLREHRHAWLIAAHHLIGDGMSAWILGQDLLHGYDRIVAGCDPDFRPLPTTFRDYVELTERAALLPRTEAVVHWRNVFADPYEAPTDWRAARSVGTDRMVHHTVDLDPSELARLKRTASVRKLTLFPLVLTAYARQLARLTARDDLVIGTALSGRDHPLPEIGRVVGCFATGVPLRLRRSGELSRIGAEEVADVFVNAMQHALPPLRIAQTLPDGVRPEVAIGAQFFFTFVDRATYGDFASDTLTVRWDESGSLYDPPLAGVDLVVAAEPTTRGLRLTLGAAASAFTPEMVAAFADGMVAELRSMTLGEGGDAPQGGGIRFVDRPLDLAETIRPDAALIGYLPPLADITGILGDGFRADDIREFIRGEVFPERRPLWIDAVDTVLGRSAFVCLPWFADELHISEAERLADAVADAVMIAGSLGARSVSMAGMIPSLTDYGFAVARRLDGRVASELTTGHAATVVSVVKAVAGTLEATARDLGDCDVAFVGLGSIGRAALELLVDWLPHPRRIILCDAPGSSSRLAELERFLRSRDYRGAIDVAEATPAVPDPVYEASVIVEATSVPGVVDVDRLLPGTILVDDSFPASFDTARAVARMRDRADVLIVGGDTLRIGPTARVVYVPAVGAAFRDRIAARLPQDEIAGCQLESLLRAVDPTLPITRGLVTLDGARAYLTAVEKAGFRPGAWQIGETRIDPSLAVSLRGMPVGR